MFLPSSFVSWGIPTYVPCRLPKYLLLSFTLYWNEKWWELWYLKLHVFSVCILWGRFWFSYTGGRTNFWSCEEGTVFTDPSRQIWNDLWWDMNKHSSRDGDGNKAVTPLRTQPWLRGTRGSRGNRKLLSPPVQGWLESQTPPGSDSSFGHVRSCWCHLEHNPSPGEDSVD